MVSFGLLRRAALVVLTRATRRNNPEDTILHGNASSHAIALDKFTVEMKLFLH
jgi:hypothetical protein